MGFLLSLLLLDRLMVVTHGHPTLEAPERVTGPWKGDVNIPCTYNPLQGYTQVLVKWLVQRGSNPVTVFLRDFSGDHIQQAKYRGRLHVNSEVLGDVSLQLKTLEMDDRSHYTCEVTWQTPKGNQVVRDEIIDLRVQKLSVSKPTVVTDSSYGFTVLQGMRISLQCQAQGSPPISYAWYKERMNNPEHIRVAALSTLLFNPAVVADSGSYFCTAKGRVGSEQSSDTVNFVVKNSSKPYETKTETPTTIHSPLKSPTVNSSWTWTTEVNHYLGNSAGSEKGLPLFAIILIIFLCCMVVFTMAIMLFWKLSKQGSGLTAKFPRRTPWGSSTRFLEHIYEVASGFLGHRVCAREARNSGETMRVCIFGSGCSSEDPATQTLVNDYSDEPCLDQEYQIITQMNGDYTCLLHTVPPDDQLLNTKGKSNC